MRTNLTALTIVLSFVISPVAVGADGAVIVRIPDGVNPVCINGSKDAVWLTMRRLVTDSSSGWLTKDQTVALLMNTTVKAKTQDQPAKAISFPLMTEIRIEKYSNGQISVPIEYTLVDGLRLNESSIRYTGLQVELTLINKKGKNKWGSALEALSEVSKKLPIPSNPYAQSAGYLLDFTNSAVAKDIKAQETDDKRRSAALALNFDPTGACAGAGGFETTGTVAVVQATGAPGADLISIDTVNSHCWSADLRPSFVLKAAPMVGGSCTGLAPAAYRPVSNHYLGFFVNAVPAENVLAGPDDRKIRDALRRCEVNGVSRKNCL